MGEQQHGQCANGEAACAAADVEGEVELDLCGLSEAGTIETTPDQLNDDNDVGDGASLPCYACLQEVDPALEPGTPGGIAAPTPTPAGAFEDLDRLLQENQRLALENQLLRENQMLRENQDRLLQENQLLRDRWEPHRARFAVQDGGGAPMMAVAPGAWAVPVLAPSVPMAVARGACAVPVAPGAWAPVDARVTQLADVQPYVAPRAARPCKRGGAAQRAPAQCAGTRAALPVTPEHERTTVMMRNLPNNYSRKMLLELLEQEGFTGKFDFLYLPIDFKTGASLGYTFVNLVDPSVVPAFWSNFDGFSDWILPSKKVCSVSWTGPHQGLNAHLERYRNSPVMHPTVPDAYKPAVFMGGVMVPFPEPTEAPRVPRVRNMP